MKRLTAIGRFYTIAALGGAFVSLMTGLLVTYAPSVPVSVWIAMLVAVLVNALAILLIRARRFRDPHNMSLVGVSFETGAKNSIGILEYFGRFATLLIVLAFTLPASIPVDFFAFANSIRSKFQKRVRPSKVAPSKTTELLDPPHISFLLIYFIPRGEMRESLLGDLYEEYQDMAQRSSRSVADAFFWYQCISIVCSLLVGELFTPFKIIRGKVE